MSSAPRSMTRPSHAGRRRTFFSKPAQRSAGKTRSAFAASRVVPALIGGRSSWTSFARAWGRRLFKRTADIPAFANARARFEPSAPAPTSPILRRSSLAGDGRSLMVVAIAISPLLADAALSAVDCDFLAGDGCRLVSGQEHERAGHVVE